MFSEDIEIEVTYIQNTSVKSEMIGIQLGTCLSISIISLQSSCIHIHVHACQSFGNAINYNDIRIHFHMHTCIHRRGVLFSLGGAGCR